MIGHRQDLAFAIGFYKLNPRLSMRRLVLNLPSSMEKHEICPIHRDVEDSRAEAVGMIQSNRSISIARLIVRAPMLCAKKPVGSELYRSNLFSLGCLFLI